MKKIAKISILAASLAASSVFASDYYELGSEANDALYHLSKYCGVELGQVKGYYPGAWVGSTGKWSNENNNYGYEYNLFYAPNYFNTESLGTLSLSATYIPNPPADGSSYKYECSIDWTN